MMIASMYDSITKNTRLASVYRANDGDGVCFFRPAHTHTHTQHAVARRIGKGLHEIKMTFLKMTILRSLTAVDEMPKLMKTPAFRLTIRRIRKSY